MASSPAVAQVNNSVLAPAQLRAKLWLACQKPVQPFLYRFESKVSKFMLYISQLRFDTVTVFNLNWSHHCLTSVPVQGKRVLLIICYHAESCLCGNLHLGGCFYQQNFPVVSMAKIANAAFSCFSDALISRPHYSNLTCVHGEQIRWIVFRSSEWHIETACWKLLKPLSS